MFDIKRVAVLGAGTMDNGVAQITAAADYTVIMQDILKNPCKRVNTINKSWP
jgi:3-hydroxyacyl-CoA dehydrogenase